MSGIKNKEQLINRLINKAIRENQEEYFYSYDISHNELINEIENRIIKYLNEKEFDLFSSTMIIIEGIKPKKFYKRYYKNNKHKIIDEVFNNLLKKGIFYDFDERYKEEIEQENMEIMNKYIEEHIEELMKEDEEIMKRKMIKSKYGKTLENELNVFDKNRFIECVKKLGINTENNSNNKQLEKIENELNRMKERLNELENKF